MLQLVVLLLVFTPMLVSKDLRTKRMQDAAEVPNTAAPYMASLHVTFKSGEKFVCGGSIITVRAILTAAHCLKKDLKPTQLRAVVGTEQLDSGGQSYGIDKIVSHEKYLEGDSNANDIAIMFTDKDIQFSDRVQPVELNDEPPKVGEELRVSGWGEIYEDGPLSNDLLELRVKVVRCPKGVAEYSDTMICAKPGPGQGICSGDSGGPLVDLKGERQVGIVSAGPTPCATGFPDQYTSVHALLPWIKKTLLDNDHDSNDYDGNESLDNDKQDQQNTTDAYDDDDSRDDDNDEQDPQDRTDEYDNDNDSVDNESCEKKT
ncbi:chymotrypsin-2-like [Aricia agestis]|uniref:chymotrypsin-2-like n=1 Tax=Aricia agestis TaxID=91739 RepID=UPI001C208AF9|nr:chymotrypsin-2-like [Aricia agestis]